MSAEVTFKVVGQEPENDRWRACRRMIVGPGVNEPEKYEGYNGFVGWPGVTRLRSGRWLLTFTSGYWHVTVPWTDEIRKSEACRKQFEAWQKIGLPDLPAPRGGRTHLMQSDDEGLTWSQPSALVDTDADDRSPTILELDDGTLLCTFFTYRLPRIVYAKYMLSHDGGKTWRYSGSTGWNLFDPHLLKLPNGVLALFHGSYTKGGIRVFLSPDDGHTWHGPGRKDGHAYGYCVDPSVYGYCHPMLLPDGTIYVGYLHTGGHRPEHARTEALWGMRVRVHDDASGIGILPAPGSPAAEDESASAQPTPETEGDDPELGNRF